MKPLKVAILGYGRSGSSLHGNPLEELNDFTVTAVCDIDQEKRQKAGERYGCRLYSDYRKMLKEEELDLVCVVTRSDQHCAMACDVMKAGVPVLVTKPWAVNASEARTMIEVSENTGTPLLPWLPARWGADYRLLKEIIESGEIGRVFCIKRAQYGFSRRNDWQTETKYGGGILLNWGPHLVDIPLLLAGGEAKSVYGTLKHIMNPNDAEDTFQAQFQMKNGTSVYTEWNFAPPGQPNWVILGDRGSLTVHEKKVTISYGEPGFPADPTNAKIMSEADLKTREVTIEGDLYGDSTEIYSHIARALRKEEPYGVTPAHALQLSIYMDGIRESSLTNNTVKWGLKYAFMTFSTPEMTLEENLAAARQYGYRGIELRIQADHGHKVETDLNKAERSKVKEIFRKSGVDLCCLATSLQFSNTPDREKTLETAREIISLASDLGAPLIRVFGGPIPKGTKREQSILETSETLKQILPLAEKKGVTLCFETHDDWCDPTNVKAVMEKVNHPNLRVNWDILHPVRSGFATVEESFSLLKPWIAHVHIHDCTFDVKNPSSFTFVPMGEGMVDHKKAVECLQEIGYTGFISGEWINYEPPEVHLPREIVKLKSYE